MVRQAVELGLLKDARLLRRDLPPQQEKMRFRVIESDSKNHAASLNTLDWKFFNGLNWAVFGAIFFCYFADGLITFGYEDREA